MISKNGTNKRVPKTKQRNNKQMKQNKQNKKRKSDKVNFAIFGCIYLWSPYLIDDISFESQYIT